MSPSGTLSHLCPLWALSGADKAGLLASPQQLALGVQNWIDPWTSSGLLTSGCLGLFCAWGIPPRRLAPVFQHPPCKQKLKWEETAAREAIVCGFMRKKHVVPFNHTWWRQGSALLPSVLAGSGKELWERHRYTSSCYCMARPQKALSSFNPHLH